MLNQHHQRLNKYTESEPESYVRFIFTMTPSLTILLPYFKGRRILSPKICALKPSLPCLFPPPPPPLPPLPLPPSSSFPFWWTVLLAHTHAEVPLTLCPSLVPDFSLPLKRIVYTCFSNSPDISLPNSTVWHLLSPFF